MRLTVLASLLLAAALAVAPPAAGKSSKHASSDLVVHFAEFNGTLQEGSSNGVYASIENTAGATSSPFVVRFTIDGSWSSDATMPAGFTGFGSPNAPDRWTATAGDHTLRVEVDATHVITEGNEADNVLVVPFTVQPGPSGGPDLLVQNAGFVDAVPQQGQSSRAWATVENAGAATQAATYLAFEVDDRSFDFIVIPAGFAGVQSFQTEESWTAMNLGQHTMRVTSDYTNAIAEEDESNNAFAFTFTVQGSWGDKAELGIWYGAINGTARDGVPIDVYAAIENTGEPTQAPSAVRFHVDGTWLGDGPVPAGFDVSMTVSSPDKWTPTPGWHTLRVVVDPDNAIAEPDETNNAFSWDFFVEDASATPDLVVLSAGVTSTPQEGHPVGFQAEVDNLGATATSDFDVAFYVDGFWIGNAPVSAGFDGPVTVHSPEGWVAREGTHTLRVTADTGGTVDEGDETNNAFETVFQVADTADTDLLVSETQFNGSFVEGHTGRFGAYVQNWNDPTPVETLVRFEVDGQWLGDAVVPAGFQGVQLFEAPQAWTATPGPHVMVATADADGRVAEPREDNNAYAWSFEVERAPPPPGARATIYAWSWDPDGLHDVETVTVTVPTDHSDVWWNLRCGTATVEAYLDGVLMATCTQGVRTATSPYALAAGDHTFMVVYAGVDGATLEVTGVPAG